MTRVDGFKYTYNGLCEVIQRQLIILSAHKGSNPDLHDLSLFDFFVQHGGDVGMPFSMHYPTSNRHLAYEVRIPMIKSALELLTASGVIWQCSDFTYRIDMDLALSADDFNSGYLKGLRCAADYLAEKFAQDRSGAIKHLSERLGEIRASSTGLPSNQQERFANLQSQYAFDYQRMVGLRESIVFQRKLFASARTEQTADLLPTSVIFDQLEAGVEKELARIPAQYHGLCDLMDELSDTGSTS